MKNFSTPIILLFRKMGYETIPLLLLQNLILFCNLLIIRLIIIPNFRNFFFQPDITFDFVEVKIKFQVYKSMSFS